MMHDCLKTHTETVSFVHGFSCSSNQLGDVGDGVMVTAQQSIIATSFHSPNSRVSSCVSSCQLFTFT